MFDKLDADSPLLPTSETSACLSAVLAATLMTHQQQGLAWMVQREQNPDPTGASTRSSRNSGLFLCLWSFKSDT